MEVGDQIFRSNSSLNVNLAIVISAILSTCISVTDTVKVSSYPFGYYFGVRRSFFFPFVFVIDVFLYSNNKSCSGRLLNLVVKKMLVMILSIS